jgi:hypothetical protein
MDEYGDGKCLYLRTCRPVVQLFTTTTDVRRLQLAGRSLWHETAWPNACHTQNRGSSAIRSTGLNPVASQSYGYAELSLN